MLVIFTDLSANDLESRKCSTQISFIHKRKSRIVDIKRVDIRKNLKHWDRDLGQIGWDDV